MISFEEDSELSKVKLSFLLLRQERYDDVIEMLAELGEAMTKTRSLELSSSLCWNGRLS